MAIKAIIIDDERLARNELKKMLQSHSEIEVIEEAANVDEGIEKIELLHPDLIFLDIQMPGKNGFELLAEVEKAPRVIFTTAYDGERCWFVKLGEIRLFESVGNYAKVYFGTHKPLILKSLNALEERLDDRMFFRANRKHIINLRWIEKIEPYFNGGLLVDLKGGEKVEVSRRQTVKFKEMMSL